MKTIIALALALTACSKDNPYYCEGQPDNRCAPAPDGGPTACQTSNDCTAPTAICEAHVCVTCTAADPSACGGLTPVCSNNSCAACVAHDQCGSDVCLGTGACAEASQVAYVSASGSGSTCTQNAPCTLAEAAQGTMPYIRVMGADTIAPTGEIQLSRTVAIFGNGGKIDRNGDGRMFVVTSGANVSMQDLEITGGTTTTGNAIELTGGELTLTRMRLANNQGQGINATGGTLTLSRSVITRNDMGGVAITSTNVLFNITNNFFYRNGNDVSAVVGGIALDPPATGMTVFEFNTVVDNEVRTGSSISGGVKCDLPTMMAPNNIVVRNYVANNAAATNANWMGVCTHPTSLVDVDIATLMFISPDSDDPFNYRLKMGSVAIDEATTASPTMIDVDGDPRPMGGAKDIGADEYK